MNLPSFWKTGVLFCLLSLALSARAAETVLDDSMGSLDKWTRADGSDPSLVAADPQTPQVQCLQLDNGVIRAELPDAISDSFTLSFKALHSDYQRGLWAGLFNADGTQGYAACWDSSNEAYVSGHGFVSLSRFGLSAPVTWADRMGKPLGEPVPSGHKATARPFATFLLSWDKPTHTLTLKVDGVVKARVVDKSQETFYRIYLRGNTHALFRDVKLVSGTGPATKPAAGQ